MNRQITIENCTVGEGCRVFIIAEMSGNHNQSLERAIEIIKRVKNAGADAVKIQTYTPDTITLESNKPYFYVNQGTLWDGTTLHKLYQKAYTPWQWHGPLKEAAEKEGLIFFSTPFDFSAVDFLEQNKVPAYKIASFEINDIPLIRRVAQTGKPLIMSTGIAYPEEVREALAACEEAGNQDVVLLKCISAYPTPLEEMNLKTIPDMEKTFSAVAGLSDHSMGCEAALGAVALGAKVIEKHFTLDRADGGVDAAFSMEPLEFKTMADSVRKLERALGTVTYELSQRQQKSREHSRSLFAVKDIMEGELLTQENIRSIRPAFGLHTRYYEAVLGKRAAFAIEKGTPLDWSHLR